MRIGILSQAIGRNYGGILQQYALSQYLFSLGHEVIIINRKPNNGGFILRKARRVLGSIGFRRYRPVIAKDTQIQSFTDSKLNLSYPVYSGHGIKRLCRKESIDCIVYGSDQIWRRSFELKYGLNYFGDFAPRNVKQIAYAPSFGLDKWEYTKRETRRIHKGLSRFVALSSREETGVRMIADNLHLNASLVCDPTILLDEDHYENLINHDSPKTPYCFVYWLGENEIMNKAIDDLKTRTSMEMRVVNLRRSNGLPGVEEWLSLVKDSQYVITDSFHGVVFSILFRRQFEVHCNKSGGFSRIRTLLCNLNLEEKLVNNRAIIDYEAVNEHLSSFREKSRSFLIHALEQ